MLVKLKTKLLFILLACVCQSVRCEPWIDTRAAHLRADIETLADIGIIQVPISTYPLMWSGILRDIDNVEIENVASAYKATYWRVKRAGKLALQTSRNKELRVSASNGEQVLRSFGDNSRGKAEVAARSYGINKYLAWNLEVTRQHDAFDGESTRYDNSYFAAVIDNWIISAGAIEKWWGAGWDSTNLLSNNARPPIGVSIQRNYSLESENIVFSWLGPWTFNGFIAQLDDERTNKNTKLTGVSFNFKPNNSIELALRATALWGGKKAIGYDTEKQQTIYEYRTESFDSLIDNFVANQNCDLENQQECSDLYSASGDRKAGVELRWKLPVDYPVSFYASAYGESECEFIPSKNMTQFGLTSTFSVFNINWKWFVEKNNTSLAKDTFNQAYESINYQTGYRYNLRAIGSTYDRDSKVSSLGILGQINKASKMSLIVSDLMINRSLINSNSDSGSTHSINSEKTSASRVKLSWQYQTQSSGELGIVIDYYSSNIDEFKRTNDKTKVSLDWTYQIN